MVYNIIVSILGLYFLGIPSFAQSDCACCTSFHHQFDFWIGKWLVYDTLGNRIGNSQIEKLEDKCIISERWQGTSGISGRSYNYFNALDSSWNQVWIDNQGNHLVLKGKGGDGKMVLTSEWGKGKLGKWQKNKITWEALSNGQLSQVWEIFDENDDLKKLVFKGIYQEK